MRNQRSLVIATTVAVVALVTITPRAETATGRLASANLSYLGFFNVPAGLHSGGKANMGFEYGGGALSFNPAKNSLFMAGHPWDQFIGEISIPAVGGTATLLQPLVDASEGLKAQINPGSPNGVVAGGTLVYGDRLIVTYYDGYDGSDTQVVSHISRPLLLSTTGQVQGPFRVGPLHAGFYSGYMGMVPSSWQAAFGGPALTGNADLNILARTSNGPGVFAFDPSNMNDRGAVPLVYYPVAHSTLGHPGADQITGVVFPVDTSTVLFFGRHGTTYCYGYGTADPELAGKMSPDGVDPYCYDPIYSSKGGHGYPYVPYVWAYDANDLVAVRTGAKQPWDIRPYMTWTWPAATGAAAVAGVAYDPDANRIYVSESGTDVNPIVHVFAVTSSGPAAPRNVRIIF